MARLRAINPDTTAAMTRAIAAVDAAPTRRRTKK